MGIKIAGLGKSVPSKVLTNADLSQMVDTNDEWIKSRTGIERRHVAVTETTTQLASEAAKEAVQQAGLMTEEIELIIVATVSPDATMPSTACKVAQIIGATKAMCFDITAACSGFIVASDVAVSMIEKGTYKNALVIGAEVLSRVVDWQDRGTCVLFADGAGAAVYKVSDENQVLAIQTGCDPKGADEITLPTGEGDKTFYEGEVAPRVIGMNGKTVYAFATTKVPESIKSLLDTQALTSSDVRWYILHQANSRIMDSVARKLDMPKDCFFKNLSEYGNTSAASIPMALYEASELFEPGDLIILSGFGAGLTWGTMLIKW
nr:beta-ketoacyl-ACP synthase III [uncultured Cellulosilyticum sp.]